MTVLKTVAAASITVRGSGFRVPLRGPGMTGWVKNPSVQLGKALTAKNSATNSQPFWTSCAQEHIKNMESSAEGTMQTADLWIAGNGLGDGFQPGRPSIRRGPARTPADLARRLGARSVHFDLLERERGGWGWTLRNAYGEELAQSHVDYPSRVQASAAAVAFSRLVAEAGRQVGGR